MRGQVSGQASGQISRARRLGLTGLLWLLAGCEHHFFQSQGVLTSEGGALTAWSRAVQGCSPDPTDGLPVGKSSTVFTLYWDNPVEYDLLSRKPLPPKPNQLQQLEVYRTAEGLTGRLRMTRSAPDTLLEPRVCSRFDATTSPDHPVIPGGRPTVDGTLELDCRVAGSHLTASVRFSGCEY